MVSAIFNSAFIVGSPDLNEISVVEGGALRNVMILSAFSKIVQLHFWKRVLLRYESDCVTVTYLVCSQEITLYTPIMLN